MIGAPERAISRVSAAARPDLVDRGDELAGDQQAPGGGVDERRGRLADMGAPFAAADLVGDQRVARRGVGNAQQRLGHAHQRDALLAGKVVFAHQSLDQAGRPAWRAIGDQPARHRLRLLGDCRRQLGGGDQRRHDLGLGRAIERVDRRAPAVVADQFGGEGGKRPAPPQFRRGRPAVIGVSPANISKNGNSYMQSTGRSKAAAPPQDIRPQWRIGNAATILGALTRFCVAALQHLC